MYNAFVSVVSILCPFLVPGCHLGHHITFRNLASLDFCELAMFSECFLCSLLISTPCHHRVPSFQIFLLVLYPLTVFTYGLLTEWETCTCSSTFHMQSLTSIRSSQRRGLMSPSPSLMEYWWAQPQVGLMWVPIAAVSSWMDATVMTWPKAAFYHAPSYSSQLLVFSTMTHSLY